MFCTGLQRRVNVILGEPFLKRHPLRRENTGEGETNPGGASPLRREKTGEGETNPGGASPLKRENAGEGEINSETASPLRRSILQ